MIVEPVIQGSAVVTCLHFVKDMVVFRRLYCFVVEYILVLRLSIHKTGYSRTSL